MLADIELGKIDMIIVKDISRLGREHIDTNYYLGRYFRKKASGCCLYSIIMIRRFIPMMK